MKHELFLARSDKKYPRNSEGDLIELADGRLLVAWSRFYGGWEDHAACEIAARVSSDRGLTWSEPYVLQKNTGKQNVMSVTLLRLRKDNRIAFFYLAKNTDSDLRSFVRYSNNCKCGTWSGPVCATPAPGYHVVNNARVIQLNSGRILIPVSHCLDISKNYSEFKNFCFISDDSGRTWRQGKGKTGFPDTHADEPGLVELKDGRILMVIRCALGRIYYSWSGDGGDTWSEPQRTEIKAPCAPATIKRIPSTQDLLLIWNNNPLAEKAKWEDRTPLTSAVSKDEGRTWQNIKDIEQDPGYSYAYTSVTFIDENAYLTYYYWGRGKKGFEDTSLKLNIIPVSWFYSL